MFKNPGYVSQFSITFVCFYLLFSTPNRFWNGPYSKRKEFAPTHPHHKTNPTPSSPPPSNSRGWRLRVRCRCSCGLHYENPPIQNIQKISPLKIENFHIKKNWYFSYFCSKHRLWVLEAVLTSTHNLCFWAEIRKIMNTPVNLSFTI